MSRVHGTVVIRRRNDYKKEIIIQNIRIYLLKIFMIYVDIVEKTEKILKINLK